MKFTTLSAQSAWLDRRKKELGLSGEDYVAANNGARRSPGKRALLRRLEQIRKASARSLAFKANY